MTGPPAIEPAVLARGLPHTRRGRASLGLLSLLLVGSALQWVTTEVRGPVREPGVSATARGSLSLALPAPAESGPAGRIAPIGSAGSAPAFGSEERGHSAGSPVGHASPVATGVVRALDPVPSLVPLDRSAWLLAAPPRGPPPTA